MKWTYLAIANPKQFWIVHYTVSGCGLKMKIDCKRQISHVFKIALKRNNLIIFEFINNTSDVTAS